MITEKQFTGQIEGLLELFNWDYSHTYEQTHYARRSTKGFPDYVAARERVIYFELKSDKGTLSWEQAEWLARLRDCGQEVYVWWPEDFELAKTILEKEDEVK